MSAVLFAVLAWSGAAQALDLPPPPADALVEREECETTINAKILVSRNVPSSREYESTSYSGYRCTWKVGEIEYSLRQGQREDRRLQTRSIRIVKAEPGREIEDREIEVLTLGPNTPDSALNRKTNSIYTVDGSSKRLLRRTTNGVLTEGTETISEQGAETDRLIVIQMSGLLTPLNNAGDHANIQSATMSCRLTRVKSVCPNVPNS